MGESDSLPLLMSNEVNDCQQNEDVKTINLKETYVIICGIFIGTAILILPFTVLQLGPISWVLVVLLDRLLCFCLLTSYECIDATYDRG